MFRYTVKKMVVLTRLWSPQLRQYPLCGYRNQKKVHTSAAYFDPMSNSWKGTAEGNQMPFKYATSKFSLI